MPRSPAMTQRLVEVAAAAARAGHGRKEAVYAAACIELGISRATLLRALGQAAVRAPRKRRSDAGSVELPRHEAVKISAVLMESHRKNAKRLLSISEAMEVLRANPAEGVRAERIDPATGEVIALSDSAIARALRTYGLHPKQLLQPAPAKELCSLHPNHVWQIDASLCVLYYLQVGGKQSGLQIMEKDRFYKNKPKNLARIENDRVWSYEITDHNSGAIFVIYVLGAESSGNIAESFIACIQQRGEDPFYGVPRILMMDMGAANTSGLFKGLLKRLQVEPIAHAPGTARATGQVEKARDIIERSFESGLKFKSVGSLDELNEQAQRWARWYNATKIHRRHGRTRFDQWMRITAEQLRIAPPADVCRELLTHGPEARKVDLHLRVKFQGREYDVSGIPRVMVGETLHITYSPYQLGVQALVVDTDAEGRELLHPIPVVERNEDGFAVDANVIGEDYRRHADTLADSNRKEVELAAMDADTLAEAAARRRAKALPFGGRIDRMRVIDQAQTPIYLPRRGTDLQVSTTVSQAPVQILTHFQVATELARRGVQMSPELLALMRSLHPDGVPESELGALQTRLTARAGLRVVGGQ